MPLSQWMAADQAGRDYTAGSTSWTGPVGCLFNHTSEARAELGVRLAGVLSKLFVYVSANALATGAVITMRKSGVDGALTVSYGAAETGIKEDTVNSDTFAATDTVAVKIVPTSGGAQTFTVRTIGSVFTPTDSTKTYMLGSIQAAGSFLAASETSFGDFIGPSFLSGGAEAVRNIRAQAAFVLSNLRVMVSSNARTTNTTFSVRKNSADGSQSVVYGSAETGVKEDTSNTDTYAVDDDMCFALTTLTGVAAIVPACVSVSYVSTARIWPLNQCPDAAGAAQLDSTTRYNQLAGRPASDAGSEALKQLTSRAAYTVKAIAAYLTFNNFVTGTFTVGIRINGANGTVAVVFGPAETGRKADTSHTDAVVAGDLINTSFVTSADSGKVLLVDRAETWLEAAATARRWILGRH